MKNTRHTLSLLLVTLTLSTPIAYARHYTFICRCSPNIASLNLNDYDDPANSCKCDVKGTNPVLEVDPEDADPNKVNPDKLDPEDHLFPIKFGPAAWVKFRYSCPKTVTIDNVQYELAPKKSFIIDKRNGIICNMFMKGCSDLSGHAGCATVDHIIIRNCHNQSLTKTRYAKVKKIGCGFRREDWETIKAALYNKKDNTPSPAPQQK